MIGSLLVANRGEIARRVVRTARRLGIRTIAVYSEADADALHVREADYAVPIGPAPARESYLVGEAILAAARETGAEAIHPGYGFLSENADFAEAVIAAGLIWVGPPPAAIRAMGLKDAAKRLMQEAGVPTTPGYLGDDQSETRLATEAARIGYPVLIKAVAGGGGKGMRKVDGAADFREALVSCRREAAASFGDDRVLIERYANRPRHIEVQVFADKYGNVVHLFERDCSLQRRHQKVIEEAPAPGMDAAMRAFVCDAAVKAAKAVAYEGAGTVEFIADASEGLRADRIWFMEMNTRLQVEHPVTEMITGQDLVEWQLRVASGEPLPLGQEQLRIQGHAIEARLYAENPANGFLPSVGPLTHFRLPEGRIRVDAAVTEGGTVTAFYDPMIAKLIASGSTRAAAAERLAAACEDVEVWPVRTNAAFLSRCLRQTDFLVGAIDTGFIAAHGSALTDEVAPGEDVLQAVARAALPVATEDGAWDRLLGFRLNAEAGFRARLQHGEDQHTIPVDPRSPVPKLNAICAEGQIIVFDRGASVIFTPPDTGHAEDSESGGVILAPMPGRIIAVQATKGESVSRGQALLTLEAMKMEHTLRAPFAGVVVELVAEQGDQVSESTVLARLEITS
jgi:propionyl-CoA carboxylase alpha chain/3-methylcrotonyl-CoA carboxylase alpha subunit